MISFSSAFHQASVPAANVPNFKSSPMTTYPALLHLVLTPKPEITWS
jgi:hypothetical protein